MIPAFDKNYCRLALFFADEQGAIIYKTDQLESNNRILGQMKQPNSKIAAVSFQDLNQDTLMDIILITYVSMTVVRMPEKHIKLGTCCFRMHREPLFIEIIGLRIKLIVLG